MSTSVEFQDGDAIHTAVKDVRDDTTGTNWVLIKHVDTAKPNTIVLAGSGSGGVEEMKAAFDPANVMYGLYRTTQTIDLSTTIKFVYVYYSGPEVPFTHRGKIGVLIGNIKPLLEPYHIDFDITSPAEIDDEKVDRRLAENSGKIDHSSDINFLEEQKYERGFTATTTRTHQERRKHGFQGNAGAQKQSMGVQFDDEVINSIQNVRNDATEITWTLATYQDGDLKKPVVFVDEGTGGVDAMLAKTAPDGIFYGLLRVVDYIDNHATTKFVYIFFLGEKVGIMKKAKVATHKGDVTATFGPFHVDFDISSTGEISDAKVMDKVSAASGSKSFVK